MIKAFIEMIRNLARVSMIGTLIFMLAPIGSSAQQLDIKHYKIEDGLSSNKLTTVIQSHDGYMWFGTNGDGLFKFNGTSSQNLGSSQDAVGDTIQVLFQDSEHRIWAAKSTGGVRMISQDSVYHPFVYKPINYAEITVVKEPQKKSLWFGTQNRGVYIWNGNQFRHLTVENSDLADNTISDIVVQDSSHIWIATPAGISLYNGDSFKNFTAQFQNISPHILFLDDQQNVWIGTTEGLFRWGSRFLTEVTTQNNQSLGKITDITENRKGNLVIGTASQGVFLISDGSTIRINEKTGLNSNEIVDLYLDLEKKIWILTNKSGAYLLRDAAFVQYSGPAISEACNISAIEYGPEDDIWLATDKGLMQWNKEKDHKFRKANLLEEQDTHIMDMGRFPDGDVLLLTAQQQLIRTDGENVRYLPEGAALEEYDVRVFNVFVNSSGDILVGSNKGLFYFTEKGLKQFNSDNGLPHHNVWHISEDKENRLWISTSRGLRVLENNKLKRIPSLEELGSDKFYRYTKQDHNGDYWLGTNEGIIYFHPGTDTSSAKTRLLNNNDGLISVDTQFLLTDNNYLWHGTSAGLNKINMEQVRSTEEVKIVHYTLANRGLGTTFNHDAALSYGEGKLWFGSDVGAIRYDADANKVQNPGPIIHITDVELSFEERNGKKYYTSVLDQDNDPDQLKSFSYYENNFSFDFLGLDYSSPEKIVYQYKLAGKDNGWSTINDLKRVSYKNLQPGSYTFLIKGRDSHGVWSDQTASFSFIINAPFWKTGWFYGLVGISLLGISFGNFKIWLNTYEKKKLTKLVDKQTEELQEGLHEKEILLAEIHHRVKNNLAVISGLVELQKANMEGEKAIRAMGVTQNRVRSIAMIHEKLYQTEMFTRVSLDKYIDELVEVISASYDIGDKQIQVELNTEDVQVTLDQSIPCGLILNELLCNAYEHAFEGKSKGKISISLKETAGIISLSVADDGKGLPKQFEVNTSDSLGLELVNVLTKQLEGNLTVTNGIGSEFLITFQKETSGKGPVSKSNLFKSKVYR